MSDAVLPVVDLAKDPSQGIFSKIHYVNYLLCIRSSHDKLSF